MDTGELCRDTGEMCASTVRVCTGRGTAQARRGGARSRRGGAGTRGGGAAARGHPSRGRGVPALGFGPLFVCFCLFLFGFVCLFAKQSGQQQPALRTHRPARTRVSVRGLTLTVHRHGWARTGSVRPRTDTGGCAGTGGSGARGQSLAVQGHGWACRGHGDRRPGHGARAWGALPGFPARGVPRGLSGGCTPLHRLRCILPRPGVGRCPGDTPGDSRFVPGPSRGCPVPTCRPPSPGRPDFVSGVG